MLDQNTLIATLGALAGVGLGGWVTVHSQRTLLRETHRQAAIAARESAYAEFLASYRQFRRLIQTEPVAVHLVSRGPGRKSVPVIEQATAQWEAVENATAQLEIVVGDRIPGEAWRDVVDAFYDIARARASCQPGEVPNELIVTARQAEQKFASVAREELRQATS